MAKIKLSMPDLGLARKRLQKDTPTYNYQITKEYSNIGQNKTYYIFTYGCQGNEADSEVISGILEDLGYVKATDPYKSNLVILNTCAIRENAENRIWGVLGNLKGAKQNNKDMLIAICGCMPQEENATNKLLDSYPFVDLIFGTHNIYDLPKLLKEANDKKAKVVEVLSTEGAIYEGAPKKREFKHKAWINIMYGCDEFCTYCIVPYTRGKERSRAKEDIINEVKELVKDGYKEVTLLGQNVNAYGKDLNLGYDFATLLEETAKIGIPRIRFVTSHPWNFTDKMIDVIAKYENIMPYIHLPIQSGSDEILKKMNRRYTISEYKKLFDSIKNKVPNVSITTDIIVGFPNETEEDFQKTLDIVNYCKFDGAYTFIFSKRVGTVASLMEDKVSFEEKEKRLHKLNELVNKYSLENNQKYLNKIVEVLVIGTSDRGDNKVCGYTDTMKLVNIVGSKDLIGKIVKVKIIDAKSFSLDGEVI